MAVADASNPVEQRLRRIQQALGVHHVDLMRLLTAQGITGANAKQLAAACPMSPSRLT